MKLFFTIVLIIFTSSCVSKYYPVTLVYFGTYTGGETEGVYVSKLDSKSGELSKPVLAAEVTNPSFVAVHPNREFLYTLSEKRGEHALVHAFKIDADGTLTKLNQQSSLGGSPCHINVDKTGKVLLIANYFESTCASYAIGKDGKIDAGTAYEHQGSSVNPKRQEGPHPHSINIDPANERAFVADLGIDQIVIYNMDREKAKLTKHSSITLPTGGGPRHFSFHPSGKFAYANLELTRQVVAMSYDQEKGQLKQLQVLSTLPEGAPAKGSTAECLVHPSGKWLYVSNRGHNSIAVFAINQTTGLLTKVEVEPSSGKIPRGFGIDPSGQFLIVGHHHGKDVNVFRINQNDGSLDFTGHSVQVKSVVNVRFIDK